jgi:hypothetical protein
VRYVVIVLQILFLAQILFPTYVKLPFNIPGIAVVIIYIVAAILLNKVFPPPNAFEVYCNDKLIHSTLQTGKYPRVDALIKRLDETGVTLLKA